MCIKAGDHTQELLDRLVNAMSSISEVLEFHRIDGDLAFELEHGSARALPTVLHRKPLYERSPVLVWQIVSIILAVLLFLSWAFR